MRASEIEAWALRVHDRIQAGASTEDSRVEVKRDWIPARRAARRLAGHANASRGESILWIIGIDEDTGELHPVTEQDLANWLPQVQKEFRGPVPACTDVVVYVEDGPLFALHFTTDQAPYVIRNSAADGSDTGPATLEVPWREGTSVRSATHADLLRLLVPVSSLPDVELLTARLVISGAVSKDGVVQNLEVGAPCTWRASSLLYVTPRSRDVVVFPVHRCSLKIGAAGHPERVGLRLEQRIYNRIVTHSDYVVDQPQRLTIEGTYKSERYEELATRLALEIVLYVAGSDREIRCSCRLQRVRAPDTRSAIFELEHPHEIAVGQSDG